MPVLAQQLDDHLVDCVRERQATNRRLGRIEGVMIAVAGGVILQLLAAISVLVSILLSHLSLS